MAILNANKYYFLNSDGSLFSKDAGYSVDLFAEWNDKTYWMIEFIHSEPFKRTPVETIVGEKIFKDILNGKITLLLVHISEAYHFVIDEIYQELIINQKIPVENILYVTNSADIDLEINAISKKYKLNKLPSMHMSSFEYGAQFILKRQPEDFTCNTLVDKTYDKKFLSLNGLWRPHRVLLGCFLTSLKLIDKGHISFNCVPCDQPEIREIFPHIIKWCENNLEGKQLLLENESSVKNLSKIFLDKINNKRPEYNMLDKKYYEDTYFSIVTETLGWKDASYGGVTTGRAISEKTFKPILLKHPFMIISLPGTLQLLKDLGYRTFNECIDESYDNEQDDSKRIYMVTKEAERLCNLSDSELKDFLKTCREITNYNFEVLKNKQQFVYKKT